MGAGDGLGGGAQYNGPGGEGGQRGGGQRGGRGRGG